LSHNHNTILSKGEWKEAYALVVKGDTTPKDQLWTGNDTSVVFQQRRSDKPLDACGHDDQQRPHNILQSTVSLRGAANQDRGSAPRQHHNIGFPSDAKQYSGSLPVGPLGFQTAKWTTFGFTSRRSPKRRYKNIVTLDSTVAATHHGGFPEWRLILFRWHQRSAGRGVLCSGQHECVAAVGWLDARGDQPV